MINKRVAEDDGVKTALNTVLFAILTGIGLGIGLYIVRKKLK